MSNEDFIDYRGIKLVGSEAEVLKRLEDKIEQRIPHVNEFKGKEWFFGFISENNHVVELALDKQELTNLPRSLGTLTKLRVLNLQMNKLEKLPSWIKNFQELQTLKLNTNLQKTLPEALGQLQRVQKLDLSYNRLEKLPKSFGNLINLETLILKLNELRKLPETFELLQKLESLDLSHNKLSRLIENFGRLQGLHFLDLSDNKLYSLPETFGQLQNLKSLNVSDNELDSLPESSGELKRLQFLDLSDNRLESLPETLGQLQDLKSLNVSNNRLKSLPEALSRLPVLETLDLSYNRIETIPSWIGELPALQTLHLGGNRLLTYPLWIGQLKGVEDDDGVIYTRSSEKPTTITVNYEIRYFQPSGMSNANIYLNKDAKNVLEDELLLKLRKFLKRELPQHSYSTVKRNKRNIPYFWLNVRPEQNFPSDAEFKTLSRKFELFLGPPTIEKRKGFRHYQGVQLDALDVQVLEALERQRGEQVPFVPEEYFAPPYPDVGMIGGGEEFYGFRVEFRRVFSLCLLKDNLKTIPASLGELDGLKYLDLRRNNLEEIPETIGNLHDLETCLLGENNLKNLPNNIGQLRNLKELDIWGNPLEIGSLIPLLRLKQANPRCEFYYPESVENHPILQNIDLSTLALSPDSCSFCGESSLVSGKEQKSKNIRIFCVRCKNQFS